MYEEETINVPLKLTLREFDLLICAVEDDIERTKQKMVEFKNDYEALNCESTDLKDLESLLEKLHEREKWIYKIK